MSNENGHETTRQPSYRPVSVTFTHLPKQDLVEALERVVREEETLDMDEFEIQEATVRMDEFSAELLIPQDHEQ